jgi:hypothetical protein
VVFQTADTAVMYYGAQRHRDIYSTRSHRKASIIIKDLRHPSHGLFSLLPSSRRRQYRCIRAETKTQRSPGHQTVEQPSLVGYLPGTLPCTLILMPHVQYIESLNAGHLIFCLYTVYLQYIQYSRHSSSYLLICLSK